MQIREKGLGREEGGLLQKFQLAECPKEIGFGQRQKGVALRQIGLGGRENLRRVGSG